MSQVVLISGCSSGFGLLTAVRAAKAGHRVFATLRNLNGRGALDEAARSAGVSLDVLPLDVNDADSIACCIDEVLRRAGRVDALVNNAGFGFGGTLFDLTLAELRAQFETNFFGTVALSKAVLPGMIERRSGRIIQVSSANALYSPPGLGAYSASKRALEGITEAMRYELAPFGVHVTSVLPGTYRTEAFTKRRIAENTQAADSPYKEVAARAIQNIDRIVETKAGDPERVAKVLVDLLTHPRPPLQKVVGADARLTATLKQLLPEPVWGRIIRKAVGF